MTVPNPDALFFQYFDGGGSAQIDLELEIETIDWRHVSENDIYLWSYGNRRTFYSFGDAVSTLQTQSASDVIIAEGFFNLADGRKDILLQTDLQGGTITVRLFTNLNVNFSTIVVTEIARAQATNTFSGVAATATDGYFTIEAKSTIPFTPLNLYGLKLIEQRIALADL